MEEYFYKLPTIKEINANTLFYLNIVPENQNEKLLIDNYHKLSLAVINEIEAYTKEFDDCLKLENKYDRIITNIFLKWKHNKEKSLLLYDREADLFNDYLKIKSIEIFIGRLINAWRSNFRSIKKSSRNVYFGIFSEYELMFLSLLFERNKISYIKSIELFPKSLVIHSLDITDEDLKKSMKGLYNDERKIVLELIAKLRVLKKRLDKILYGIYCIEEARNEMFKENIIALKSEIKSFENKLKFSKKHNLLNKEEIEINDLYLEIYNIYLLSLENVNRQINNNKKWIKPAYAKSFLSKLINLRENFSSKPSIFITPRLKLGWIEKKLNGIDLNNKNEYTRSIGQKFNLFINHKGDYLSFSNNFFINYRKAWFNRKLGIGTIEMNDDNKLSLYRDVLGLKTNIRWTSSIFSQVLKQNISLYNRVFKDYINKPGKQGKDNLKKAFLYSYLINLSFLSAPQNSGGGQIFYIIGKQIRDVLVVKERLIVDLYKKKIIHADNLVDYIELMRGEGTRNLRRYQKLMNKAKQQFLDEKLNKNNVKKIKNDLMNKIIKSTDKALKEDAYILIKEYKNDLKFDKKIFIKNTDEMDKTNINAIFKGINLYLNNISKSMQNKRKE